MTNKIKVLNFCLMTPSFITQFIFPSIKLLTSSSMALPLIWNWYPGPLGKCCNSDYTNTWNGSDQL